MNDSLRTRASSLERELSDKGEYITSLRTERDLLDEIRQKTQAEIEAMAAKWQMADLTVSGPKLPPPLDRALKQFADEHPSSVVYNAASGHVKWNADLLFASGSDVVRDSSKETLRQFSEIINSPAAADFEVIVVGHTDTQPIKRTVQKHPTNWHLSAHRAISVATVLLSHSYPAQRIGVMGCGEYRPMADNSTSQGASKNRRVEIYLVPAGSIVQATDAG